MVFLCFPCTERDLTQQSHGLAKPVHLPVPPSPTMTSLKLGQLSGVCCPGKAFQNKMTTWWSWSVTLPQATRNAQKTTWISKLTDLTTDIPHTFPLRHDGMIRPSERKLFHTLVQNITNWKQTSTQKKQGTMHSLNNGIWPNPAYRLSYERRARKCRLKKQNII
jgi:hypothetical protein